MRPPLDHATREWVQGHEAAMRRAAANAITASNRWRQLDAELDDKYKAEGRDSIAASQAKATHPGLADAYGAFTFFATKTQLHSAALQGELAARALLDGVNQDQDPDPTGMRYDRADTAEPVSPVPDFVDGLSITGRPPRRPNSSPAGHVTDTRRAARSSSRPVGAKQGAAGAGVPAAPAGAVA
ncbi:hypothetical protein ACWD6N_03705 [Micromonospora sp. NPDC005163]